MSTWFECRIRHEKTTENGYVKKVTESYLVDALSFTEAEARIIEEMAPSISGEFTVSDIKRVNYNEIICDNESDTWFRCKVNFVTLNEKTGKEKKNPCYILVQGASIEDANKRLNENLRASITDYEIVTIQETNIFEVYR